MLLLMTSRQYHTHSSSFASAIEAFPDLKDIQKLEYDRVAEFWMPDASCFHKARQDPYYEQVVMPDENHLLEWETVQWSVLEEVYVKDGKVFENK